MYIYHYCKIHLKQTTFFSISDICISFQGFLRACHVHVNNNGDINIDSASSFLIHFIRCKGAYLGIDVVEFVNIVDIGPFFDIHLVNIGWSFS